MDYLAIGEQGLVNGEAIRGMRNTRAPVESFTLIDSAELARLEAKESVSVCRLATKGKIRRNGRAEWLPLVAVRKIKKPLSVESVRLVVEIGLGPGRESPGEVRRVVVGLVKVVFQDAKII